MTHKRQTIRTQINTAIGVATAAGTSVFIARTNALKPGDLPAIVIEMTRSEIAERSVESGTVKTKQVAEIEIEAVASTINAADSLAEEIEAKLEVDRTLGANVEDVELVETRLAKSGEGAEEQFAAILEYKVTWHQ